MINFGGNPASLLGIALAICGVALYFMRTFRPGLSRDSDIFFSAVALICGGILLFQGWRLDPLLFLGQLALAGSAVFFAIENIRLRGITTEQAKRVTPVVDDERPVSRVYRAELDELPYADDPYGYEQERAPVRRIRGSRDPRTESASYERDRPSSGAPERDRYSSGSSERDRYLGESPSRRPSSRSSASASGSGSERRLTSSGGSNSGDRPPRRRPSSSSRPSSADSYATWEDEPPVARPSSSSRPRSERGYRADAEVETADAPASSSRRRTRPPSVSSSPSASSSSSSRRRTPSSPSRTEGGDYADYQPIDYAKDDVSGSSTDLT